MTVLSAQSIRRLCLDRSVHNTSSRWHKKGQMIDPFSERALHEESGMTYGLGPCTYDLRIRQTVVIPPLEFRLASTVEGLWMPPQVCATVLSKSTLARATLSANNTHVDPGFKNITLTLELFNQGQEVLRFVAGQPIVQLEFKWLDEPTELMYDGKYNDIVEEDGGPTPAHWQTVAA